MTNKYDGALFLLKRHVSTEYTIKKAQNLLRKLTAANIKYFLFVPLDYI